MNNILIGTSGYDYPEWKNIFYPQNVKRTDFLSFYSSKFNSVEINNTFYSMPDEFRMRKMITNSNHKIFFSIKVPRIFTHETLFSSDIVKYSEQFRIAMNPLIKENLLSSVLIQFPEHFRYSVANRFYLNELLHNFTNLPCVIEFRHKEWMKESVFSGLDKLNCGLCICDMPKLKSLPSLQPIILGNKAYIRFHGRNQENWYQKSTPQDVNNENGKQRYNYCYSPEEIEEAAQFIHSIASRAKLVQVFFNNHPNGSAAINAKQLDDYLQKL